MFSVYLIGFEQPTTSIKHLKKKICTALSPIDSSIFRLHYRILHTFSIFKIKRANKIILNGYDIRKKCILINYFINQEKKNEKKNLFVCSTCLSA